MKPEAAMKHVVQHGLSPEVSKRLAELAFASYRQRYAKYDPTLRWTTDIQAQVSFTAAGMTFEGSVELLPNALSFELDVPFVFRIFKSRAVAIVEREVAVWAEKAKAEEPPAKGPD